MIRKCTICLTEKQTCEFSKQKSMHDGLKPSCKQCDSLKKSKYYKTVHGVITKIYATQVGCSIKRGHVKPKYTKKEFYEWFTSQVNYPELYENWVKSGYNKWYKPSVDRLDNSIGYQFDNIRLVTWMENNYYRHESTFKKVKQIKNGEVINTFDCISVAGRATGSDRRKISAVCLGQRKTHNGFVWQYA